MMEHTNQQLNSILETILSLARFDYSKQAEVNGQDDLLDAIAVGVNLLQDELKAKVVSRNELQESEEKFQVMFENVRDMLTLHTPEGRYLQISPSIKEILGFLPEDLLGKDPYDYFHPEDRERIRETSHKALLSGMRPPPIRYRMRRKDGSFAWVETINDFILDQDGEIKYILSSTRDISDKKATEDKIQHMNEQLEEMVNERTQQLADANKDLESFNYSVSHDLRSPLRVMSGFSQMLERDYSDRLDEKAIEWIQLIRDGAHKMDQLIKDLLDFSSLGSEDLKRETVHMEQLVKEVWEEETKLPRDPQPELICSELHTVYGDASMIRQILQNLISNALKYAHPDRPLRLEISSEKCADGICFSVADNGIGFSPDYSAQIFKVFKRLHADDQIEGTGIGLAIVDRILNTHRGKIWVESTPGEGSVFTFSLPLQTPRE
jgi:PAS domain S-box-containing protein